MQSCIEDADLLAQMQMFQDFMCSSSPTSTRFQLYGVVNHHGNVGGGHYTAHAVACQIIEKLMFGGSRRDLVNLGV